MEKRGQFYFITAIIIVFLFSALTSVSTYVLIKPSPKAVIDLTSDLNREGYRISEYGFYNDISSEELISDFVGRDLSYFFLKRIGEDSNIIFVYGNRSNLDVLQYVSVISGEINLGSMGWKNFNSVAKIKKLKESDIVNDVLEIKVLDEIYSVQLKDNEVFYFVVVSQDGDEIFVINSDQLNEETE